MLFKKDDIVKSELHKDGSGESGNFIIVSGYERDRSYSAYSYPASDGSVYELEEDYINLLTDVEIAQLNVGGEDRPKPSNEPEDEVVINSLNLSLGDTVGLKSGGPFMSVAVISDYDDSVQCCWFDESKNIRYSDFKSELLNKHRNL